MVREIRKLNVIDKVEKKKVVQRTLRLKLELVDKGSKDRIDKIVRDCPYAANGIINGQWFNDYEADALRYRVIGNVNFKELTDCEKEEYKNKLSSCEDILIQKYGTKRQATTERDIKNLFPEIPPCVTNPLNNKIVSTYNKVKGDIKKGNRVLSTFKKDMPIPTTLSSVVFGEDKGKFFIVWSLSRSEKIKFKIKLGKDKSGYKQDLVAIINKTKNICAPEFQYKKRNFYLLLPVKDEVNPHSHLFNDRVVGIDLGLNIPAYASCISNGSEFVDSEHFGSKESFLKVRLQFRNRKRQLQKDLQYVNGGKGRRKKTKALDEYEFKERNYCRTYNHNLTSKIIDFAIKCGAKHINLESLKGFREKKILGFWSYFEMQTLLEYKAKRNNIEVHFVSANYTSQTCSQCGNCDKTQRKGVNFTCNKCGYVEDADFNASINIAKSIQFVANKKASK